MKKKTIIFIMAQLIVLLIFSSTLFAWTGDTWGPISRETILRIADEMIDFSWTPKNTMTNWNYKDKATNKDIWYTFYKGTVYWGEAYCQQDPQKNWAEFYSLVNNSSGGTTYYGNDCSGFVSISWELPERYSTPAFECDAINTTTACNQYNPSTDDYVTSLADIGSSQKVGLLLGDAFVKSGSHILLFQYYLPDGSGIKAMEQTSIPAEGVYWARRSDWNWSRLASYRPIRRNNIDEGNYFLN